MAGAERAMKRVLATRESRNQTESARSVFQDSHGYDKPGRRRTNLKCALFLHGRISLRRGPAVAKAVAWQKAVVRG